MRDHTSLRAWQCARAVAFGVLRLGRSHWKPWAAAHFDQALRASLSVQLNIAEGYAFGDGPTFVRHLRIAYGSAVETGDILVLLRDAEVVDAETIASLIDANAEGRACLVGLLRRRNGWRPTQAGTH
ncbi:MAG: four helix bundle protein [Gemmatimonadales bacterium]